MAAKSSDKALITGALLLALLSACVFGLYTVRKARPPEGTLPPVKLVETAYTATIADAVPVKTDTWSPPAAQSRGRDWICLIYDES